MTNERLEQRRFLDRINGTSFNGKTGEKVGDLVPDMDPLLRVEMRTGDILAALAAQNPDFRLAVLRNGKEISQVFGVADDESGQGIFEMTPTAVLRVVDRLAGRKVVFDILEKAIEYVRGNPSCFNGDGSLVENRLVGFNSQEELGKSLNLPLNHFPRVD